MVPRSDLDKPLESLARGFNELSLKSQNPVLKFGCRKPKFNEPPLVVVREYSIQWKKPTIDKLELAKLRLMKVTAAEKHPENQLIKGKVHYPISGIDYIPYSGYT